MLDRTIAYGLDFLFPATDSIVGPCLSQHGEFSRIILDLFLEMGKDLGPATMIDVGANIGSISLPFAKALPDWRVISIEAHRGIAGILAANALNNQLYNVEVINAAAGPDKRMVDFPATSLFEKMNFGNVGFDDKQSRTTPTAMISLDEIAPSSTRLVKIDVENFEPQVIRGANRLLANQETAWLVEASVQFPTTSLETIKIFSDAGYSVFWVYVPHATPKSAKNKPNNALSGDANVLALPAHFKNIWDLKKVLSVNEARPSNASDYPYLARYGYT
jgi:FkbM family methyltransferase